MTNYKMLIQYDGSRYKGWQGQKHTDMTIQGKLQEVLSKMSGEETFVYGSGRTDTGVHALGQTANFKLQQQRSCKEIQDYLSEYLPEDIAVWSLEFAEPSFHSRLNAKEKTYRYRIWTSKIPNVFERKYMTTIIEPLNVNQIKVAAGYLLGTHDFTAFCGNRKFKKSPVRTIFDIRVEQSQHEIQIIVSGNGFLQNMMRILVGTLVEVGLGKRKPEDVIGILDSRDREQAGITMPAKGLCLMEVRYE